MIIGFLGRLFGRDNYIGTTVYIHGNPYVFERRIGNGAFGRIYFSNGKISLKFVCVRLC